MLPACQAPPASSPHKLPCPCMHPCSCNDDACKAHVQLRTGPFGCPPPMPRPAVSPAAAPPALPPCRARRHKCRAGTLLAPPAVPGLASAPGRRSLRMQQHDSEQMERVQGGLHCLCLLRHACIPVENAKSAGPPNPRTYHSGSQLLVGTATTALPQAAQETKPRCLQHLWCTCKQKMKEGKDCGV